MPHSSHNSERTISAAQAVEHALSAAERCGLSLSNRQFGDAIKTTSCTLIDDKGQEFHGTGKGLGDQSTASAVFEALEHYFYYTDTTLNSGPISELDLERHDRFLLRSSPDFSYFKHSDPVALTRLKFTRLDNDQKEILYPAFLTNPDFQSTLPAEEEFLKRTRLRRYSTNSGTASGLTVEEAVLHALLEIVERDSLSIELLKTVMSEPPLPVRRLSVHSYPRSLQALCRMAEQETNAELSVWEMTTDIGVPSFLACLRQKTPSSDAFFGSGASLSVDYAIERAVLEAVQGVHVFTHLKKREPVGKMLAGIQLTKYQRCLLEYGIFGYRGGEVTVDYNQLIQPAAFRVTDSLPDQIRLIVKLLATQDVAVYQRLLYDDGIKIAQVVAPQLERFFLITAGLLLVPGERGRLHCKTLVPRMAY